MAKKLLDIRFGIYRDDGFISSVWRLWVTPQGDIYLTTQGMGGIEKYSFHKSGICRHAFTKEHGVPRKLSDRAVFKWRRMQTPPAGDGKAARIAWLAFPTDFLSRLTPRANKPVIWIPAAPYRWATYIELAYTLEAESRIRREFQKNDRQLLRYILLPSGEAFFMDYYHADWSNRDLKSPTSNDSVFPDLVFSADDPQDTGRPIRIWLAPPPKDGNAVHIQELGGYKATQ